MLFLTGWIYFTIFVFLFSSGDARQLLWGKEAFFEGLNINVGTYTATLGQRAQLVATTRIKCALGCLQKAWCRSFFYVESSGACYVHEDIFDSTVQTVSAPGWQYYKYADASYCPRWKGYTTEPHSGLCYKIMYTRTTHVNAQTLCAAEGASMVTLDTDIKVQGMMDVLIKLTALYNRWIHIGASRPAAEWGTTFTANSNFLQWEKTGQALDKVKWFTPPEPTYSSLESCMFVGVFPSYYTNFTTFTTFYNFQCTWSSEFVCEMYHG